MNHRRPCPASGSSTAGWWCRPRHCFTPSGYLLDRAPPKPHRHRSKLSGRATVRSFVLVMRMRHSIARRARLELRTALDLGAERAQEGSAYIGCSRRIPRCGCRSGYSPPKGARSHRCAASIHLGRVLCRLQRRRSLARQQRESSRRHPGKLRPAGLVFDQSNRRMLQCVSWNASFPCCSS